MKERYEDKNVVRRFTDKLSSRDRRSTQNYRQGNLKAKNYQEVSYNTFPTKEYEVHLDRLYEIHDDDKCILFSGLSSYQSQTISFVL